MNSKAFLETIDIAIQVFWFPSCQRLIRSWTLSLIFWFRWMQTSLLRTISTRKSRKMERNRKRWKKSFKLKRTRMMYVDIESQALVSGLFAKSNFILFYRSWIWTFREILMNINRSMLRWTTESTLSTRYAWVLWIWFFCSKLLKRNKTLPIWRLESKERLKFKLSFSRTLKIFTNR